MRVEECPQVEVGGHWILLRSGCRTNPPEGTVDAVFIAASVTIHCSVGARYKTWVWDYVPVSPRKNVSGSSGPVRCRR